MNREVCEHFNPVDLPCAKCAEKRKSEAMFLADELEAPLGTIIGAELQRRAAAELRRLYEANEAFGKRQQWWNERMFTLEQQRDALLEALKLSLASHGLMLTSDPPQDAWKANCVEAIAYAAIKAVEGKKT